MPSTDSTPMEDPFVKEMEGLTETEDKAKVEVVAEVVAVASEEENVEAGVVEVEERTGQAGTK